MHDTRSSIIYVPVNTVSYRKGYGRIKGCRWGSSQPHVIQTFIFAASVSLQ